jgi:hypothetical protein
LDGINWKGQFRNQVTRRALRNAGQPLRCMTQVAYELTQFVTDLRTITAEMHDPRASLVRVPLALASTRLVSARLGPKDRQRFSAA